MAVAELTQLVVFRTHLSAESFTSTWRPVASGFLGQGLSTIALAAFDPARADGIGFVSRNTWPEPAYRRAFPGGLAADGGGGAVQVEQAGVFTVHGRGAEPVATARPALDLALVLLRLHDADSADVVADALLAALEDDPARQMVAYRGVQRTQRFHVAATVHGAADTSAAAAALETATSAAPEVASALVLRGREILSMPS